MLGLILEPAARTVLQSLTQIHALPLLAARGVTPPASAYLTIRVRRVRPVRPNRSQNPMWDPNIALDLWMVPTPPSTRFLNLWSNFVPTKALVTRLNSNAHAKRDTSVLDARKYAEVVILAVLVVVTTACVSVMSTKEALVVAVQVVLPSLVIADLDLPVYNAALSCQTASLVQVYSIRASASVRRVTGEVSVKTLAQGSTKGRDREQFAADSVHVPLMGNVRVLRATKRTLPAFVSLKPTPTAVRAWLCVTHRPEIKNANALAIWEGVAAPRVCARMGCSVTASQSCVSAAQTTSATIAIYCVPELALATETENAMHKPVLASVTQPGLESFVISLHTSALRRLLASTFPKFATPSTKWTPFLPVVRLFLPEVILLLPAKLEPPLSSVPTQISKCARVVRLDSTAQGVEETLRVFATIVLLVALVSTS
mmetsp:Transcript_23956/g.33759  ORF Transcript_23956/g.33759 Transcript_23956/m.33759 type:complete len:429 (+) Transcript_23956:510-1796(+)